MKVWYNVSFKGVWPVGTAAIVVAKTAQDACRLLQYQLPAAQAKTVKPEDFVEIDTTKEYAIVLRDGDY